MLRAADPAQPVVTVPRGITATISGVTIAGGRVGVLVTGRSALTFTMVSENLSGGIEVRDSGTFEADKLRVSRNQGPGLTVTKAEAVIRGGLINHNFSNGEGAGNLGASKAGERGGTGRIESKGWNLLMEMGDWPLHVACGRLEPRPARGGCDVGAFERQPDDVMP